MTPTPDNPHDDPLIALAEADGRFTPAGALDTIGRYAQESQAYPAAKWETILMTLRAIESEAKAGWLKAKQQEETQAKMTAALKLARRYVAKMAADLVPTVVPPSNALRVIDGALAAAEPDAGHERLANLPVAVFYGDLPEPDETPEAVVVRAQGNGRRVFIVGLTPETVASLTSDPNIGPLIAIEQAIKHHANLPMADPAPAEVEHAVEPNADETECVVCHTPIQYDGEWEHTVVEQGPADLHALALNLYRATEVTDESHSAVFELLEALSDQGLFAWPGRPDQPPVACTHPETRQETHTYCATPDGCGACLG